MAVELANLIENKYWVHANGGSELVPIRVIGPVQMQGLPVDGEPPITPVWGVRVPTTTGASKRGSRL